MRCPPNDSRVYWTTCEKEKGRYLTAAELRDVKAIGTIRRETTTKEQSG